MILNGEIPQEYEVILSLSQTESYSSSSAVTNFYEKFDEIHKNRCFYLFPFTYKLLTELTAVNINRQFRLSMIWIPIRGIAENL